MFIEPTITWVPSQFSGYIWLDTKIVFLKKNFFLNLITSNHLSYLSPDLQAATVRSMSKSSTTILDTTTDALLLNQESLVKGEVYRVTLLAGQPKLMEWDTVDAMSYRTFGSGSRMCSCQIRHCTSSLMVQFVFVQTVYISQSVVRTVPRKCKYQLVI